MNPTQSQRFILLFAAFASLICFLFPPWLVRETDVSIGHHIVFGWGVMGGATIDIGRLLVYHGLIAVSTLLLLLIDSLKAEIRHWMAS